jgi:signal transduction histidine kinase
VKLKLTVTIISLLVVAMLLINIVQLFLWKHDALQREARHDQAVLAHVHSLFLHEREIAGERSIQGLQNFSFSDFYGSSETGRFLFSLKTEAGQESREKARSEEDKITALLLAMANKARDTGQPVSRTAAAFSHIFSCNDLLLNARPIILHKEIIGAVAVARSLDPLFLTLWQHEKTLLIYLLLNVLLLGLLGLFRVANLVIRPVDRLVDLADQYSTYEPFQFVAEHSGGAFGKLSKSLNSMLVRIEKDRQTLEETVTALEQANRTLKKQQQEMVRTEKLATVGRMAAGLAHEIGNPLSVVQGYLGLLLAAKGQREEHRDFLYRSEQEVQRIDRLLRQLLDFSRASQGNPQIFSLHEVLHSVFEMVKMQTAFRDIALVADFAAEEDQLYADSEQLRQVFVNCLLNSADAIHQAVEKDEKRTGKIIVSTAVQGALPDRSEKENPQLVVQIKDNGKGITGEELPLVFDPFYTTKEPGKGTGLGLSVSRSLVEATGGTMELHTEIEQGTSMVIMFPLIIERTIENDMKEEEKEFLT